MKAAAIASSSKLMPACGVPAFSRAAKTRPASAASTPMLTNARKTTRLLLTPDSFAAASLPPIA